MVKVSSILTFLTVAFFAIAIALYAALIPEEAEARYFLEGSSDETIDCELEAGPLDEYQIQALGAYIDEYGDEITIKGNIVCDSNGNYLGTLDGDILDEDM